MTTLHSTRAQELTRRDLLSAGVAVGVARSAEPLLTRRAVSAQGIRRFETA